MAVTEKIDYERGIPLDRVPKLDAAPRDRHGVPTLRADDKACLARWLAEEGNIHARRVLSPGTYEFKIFWANLPPDTRFKLEISEEGNCMIQRGKRDDAKDGDFVADETSILENAGDIYPIVASRTDDKNRLYFFAIFYRSNRDLLVAQ